MFVFIPAESFWKNPQFRLVVSEKDVDDSDFGEDEFNVDDAGGGEEDEVDVVAPAIKTEKQEEKKKKGTILVELLQKYRRQKDKVNFLYIAFHIYKVRDITYHRA